MFDALEDTPREFQVKLVDALNSLGETMQVPPTEAFNKVLCKSDDKNEDVKKKLYNWWRAFFEVLGNCEKIPNDRKTEFNQKIDDLMAEIMKAGDSEAADEEEPVMESDDEGLGYQQATKDDEDQMLADMDFAIQHIGEVANKVKAVVNFINPYCGTEVNESDDQPKFKVGDVVKVMGVSGMDFYGRDAPIGPIVKIEPPHPDVGVYEYLIKGRSGEFFAYEDELELFPEKYTEENDIMSKPGRFGIGDHVLYKGEECVVTDVDEDLRNDEEIYQVSRDSDKVDGLSFNDWVTWDEIEPIREFTENIGKFNFHVGDKVKVVGRGLASKGWIGVVSSVDKSSPGLPYTVDFEGRESGEYAPDELAPAKGFTEEENNTMKFKKIDERIGGGSDEWVSIDDYVGEEFGESSLENELDKGDDGWTTIGQPVGESGDETYVEPQFKVGDKVNWIEPDKGYPSDGWTIEDVSPGKHPSGDDLYIISRGKSSVMNIRGSELRPEGMMNEAKVVVEVNDVWDVLDLLDNDIAHNELTDLINSHLRTEDEIMDAIDELCGETITKNELNTLLSGRMATLVDYLGLDVEEYENMGNFKDSGKPTSVELERSNDEIQGGEVKDGDKQVTQDGETKTLVAGEGENKKPVCEMTIEQEVPSPQALSNMLWGQGKENLEELLQADVVDDDSIMQMLEDMGLRNLTEINDLFSFDFENVLDSLGLDAEAWSQNLEIKRKGGED